LEIRLRLEERRDGITWGYCVHQTRSRGKSCAGRQPKGSAHADVTSYHHHSTALALVISRAQPAHPAGGELISDDNRPGWIRLGMTDVHHSDITDLIPCKKVSTPEPSEGDGEVCSRRSVHDAREEIKTRWSIDGYHRDGEIMNAAEEPGDPWAWSTRGSGPEQRVDC
jgi:hypothetical protein